MSRPSLEMADLVRSAGPVVRSERLSMLPGCVPSGPVPNFVSALRRINGGLSRHDFPYRHLDPTAYSGAFILGVLSVVLPSSQRRLLLHTLPTCFTL